MQCIPLSLVCSQHPGILQGLAEIFLVAGFFREQY